MLHSILIFVYELITVYRYSAILPAHRTVWYCSQQNLRQLDIRHLKRLTRPELFQAVGEGKGVVHVVLLEYAKAPIKRYFPAGIGVAKR